MPEQTNWELLAKHLARETTGDEEARLEAWLAEAPERRALLADLAELWAATPPAPQHFDVDALWERVRAHAGLIGDAARAGASAVETPSRGAVWPDPARPADRHRAPGARTERGPVRSARHARTRRIAVAALTLPAVLGAILLGLWVNDGQALFSGEPLEKVFATERGQRATVRLPDGTLVRLNAASTLALAPDFGAAVRTVRLEGEAYFDVARDPERPFVVRAGRTTARVLGTGFNVTAYPDEAHVRVVVAEGKVAFEVPPPASNGVLAAGAAPAGTPEPPPGVVLTARQMAEYDGQRGLVRGRADVRTHVDWTEGFLHFEAAPFREVARKLARWYDVDVVIDEAAVPPGHLSARFPEGQPLGDVLSVVATVFELRFEQEQGVVRFHALEPGRIPPGGTQAPEPASPTTPAG